MKYPRSLHLPCLSLHHFIWLALCLVTTLSFRVEAIALTSNQTLDNDLIGHWTTKDINGTVIDQSTFHLNGSLKNPLPDNAIENIPSILFGEKSYIIFDPNQGPNLSGSFTFTTWFKDLTAADQTSTKHPITVAKWEGINHERWEIGLDKNSQPHLHFQNQYGQNIEKQVISINPTSRSNKARSQTFNLRDQSWHHLAVTYDLSINTANAYIDNQLYSSELIRNWSGIANAASFQFGSQSNVKESVVGHVKGNVDTHIPSFRLSDIRLYRRALTTAELQTISEEGRANLNAAKGIGDINQSKYEEKSRLTKTQILHKRMLDRIARYHGVDPVPQEGLRLWLDAQYDVGSNSKGQVSAWDNQVSTNPFSALQNSIALRPVLAPNAPNKKSVVHFDSNKHQCFNLPEELMKNTSTLEMFILLRAAPDRDVNQPNAAPVSFSTNQYYGSYNNSFYPDKEGHICDNFGYYSITDKHDTGKPQQDLSQFHLYNVNIKDGEWTSRINSSLHYTSQRSTSDKQFGKTAPYFIGANGSDSSHATYFSGDIAAVLIYDHSLNDTDRLSIGRYLNDEYGFVSSVPPVPAQPEATAISPTQVSVTWQMAMVDNSSTTYAVERKGAADSDFKIIAQQTDISNFLDVTNLNPGESYSYRICAINYAGRSEYTNILNVTLPKANTSAALPFNGLRLWLSADCGIGADGLSTWLDRSQNAHIAKNRVSSNAPTWIPNAINNKSVVRFDGSKSQYLELPEELMKNTSTLEMFILLRTAPDRDVNQSNAAPVSFSTNQYYGSYNNSFYPDKEGHICDNFGYYSTTDKHDTGKPQQDLSQFHLYNVSIKDGEWTSHINSSLHYTSQRSTSDKQFGKTAPYFIGANGSDSSHATYFSGDIAEIFLYDHPVSEAERITIGRYLNSKYQFIDKLPLPPTDVRAEVLSSTQLNLFWLNAAGSNETSTAYRVERRGPTDTDFVPLAAHWDINNFIDSNITPETTYLYRVCATNFAGDSEYSPPITVTTPKQKLENDTLPLDHLRLWLSSNYFLNQSSGQTINKWQDYSSLRHHAKQANETLQPTVLKDAVNGRPAVRFEGSLSEMLDLPADLISQAKEGEMVIVWQVATNLSSGTNNGAVSFGLSSSVNQSFYPAKDGHIYNSFGSSSGQDDRGLPNQDLTHFHIYDAVAKPGQWSHWFNGVLGYSSDNTQSSFSDLGEYNLGLSAKSPNVFFSGNIAEILLFDCALNDTQRAVLNDFLARKYMPPDYDPFGDGLTIEQRVKLGLDPFNADNNGDGISDGLSTKMGIDPLAPNPWFKPDSLPASPDDHMPPVITIISPVGGLLPVSSFNQQILKK